MSEFFLGASAPGTGQTRRLRAGHRADQALARRAQNRLDFVDEEAVAELGLEPGGFGWHDAARVCDGHELVEGGREHGEGDFGLA